VYQADGFPTSGDALYHDGKPTKTKKVVFENPGRVPLSLRLRNADGEAVYQKSPGRVASYNGRVYLSEVTHGEYAPELMGQSVGYAKPLQLGTKADRLAQVR
jgi:hypothetical protein